MVQRTSKPPLWGLIRETWGWTPLLHGQLFLVRMISCPTRSLRAIWMPVSEILGTLRLRRKLWNLMVISPWMMPFRSPLVTRWVRPRSKPNQSWILRYHRHFFAKTKKCCLPAQCPIPVLRSRIPLACWMASLFSLQRPTTSVARSFLVMTIRHQSRTRSLLPSWTH